MHLPRTLAVALTAAAAATLVACGVADSADEPCKGFTEAQIVAAQQVVEVGKDRGLPETAIRSAVIAGWGETHMGAQGPGGKATPNIYNTLPQYHPEPESVREAAEGYYTRYAANGGEEHKDPAVAARAAQRAAMDYNEGVVTTAGRLYTCAAR